MTTFLINNLRFLSASAEKFECDDGLVLLNMRVDLQILQDASASYSKDKETLAEQMKTLTQNIEDTFYDYRFGLASFIDDVDMTNYDFRPDVYCYQDDLMMSHDVTPDSLYDTIKNMPSIGNYDDQEGLFKALAINLRNDEQWWDGAGELDYPILRLVIAATDNPSKMATNTNILNSWTNLNEAPEATEQQPKCATGSIELDGSCHDEFNTWGQLDPDDVCGLKLEWHERRQQAPSIKDIADQIADRDIRISVLVNSEGHDYKEEWWEKAESVFQGIGVDFTYYEGAKTENFAEIMMNDLMIKACTNPPEIEETTSTTTTVEADTPTDGPGGGDEGDGPSDGPGDETSDEKDDDNTAVIIGTTVAASAAVIGGIAAGGYFYMGGTIGSSPPTAEGFGETPDVPEDAIVEREQYVNPYEAAMTMYK